MPVRRRLPADRDEQLGPWTVAPSSRSTSTRPVPPDRRLDTGRADRRHLAQPGLDLLGGERLLPRDQPWQSLDHGHARAEGGPRLGELDADDPAAEDEQALRHGLGRRRLAIRPCAGLGEPRDRRHRCAAPRLRARPPSGPRARRRRRRTRRSPSTAAVPAHELDSALLEPRELARVVEVVDHLVAPLEHGVRVDPVRLDARHPFDLGQQLAGRSSAFDGMQAQ